MNSDPELEAVKRELQELKRELAQQKSNFNHKKPPDLSNQIAIGLLKAFMVGLGVWIIINLVMQLFLSSLSVGISSPSAQRDRYSNSQPSFPDNRDDGTIASEVGSKLGANLVNSAVAIKVINGAVTVSGTVSNQSQLERIAPLVKQIAGVRSVVVKVTVATPASSKR